MDAPVFEVDTLANMHSHIREGNEIMGPLIDKAIEGGADVLLAMPNTKKGLKTAAEVVDYTEKAKRLVPEGRTMHFIPTMLGTEDTPLDEIDRAVDAGIFDIKFLPYLRTMQSHNGVRHYGRLLPLVKRCGLRKMRTHWHPEHPWMKFDNRDAEFAFLPILDMFLNETDVVIISEHGSDARCIPFWKEMAESGRFYVTLTAHHILTNEDDAFGDVRAVCKPPIKTRRDMHDLVRLITEDHDWVMAGGDDAPHDAKTKHTDEGGCSCGDYTAPSLLALYAHALPHLLDYKGSSTFVHFTSGNARKLYGLPRPKTLKLRFEDFEIPKSYETGPWTVMPFWAGRTIKFQLEK